MNQVKHIYLLKFLSFLYGKAFKIAPSMCWNIWFITAIYSYTALLSASEPSKVSNHNLVAAEELLIMQIPTLSAPQILLHGVCASFAVLDSILPLLSDQPCQPCGLSP